MAIEANVLALPADLSLCFGMDAAADRRLQRLPPPAEPHLADNHAARDLMEFCDVTIGRHDFTRAEIGFGDGVAGYALQVHIPPTGRLDEAESVASISRGLEFFAEHYPDRPASALVCKSWLLDPQLGDYLPPDSNLIRFQRRFRLLPHVLLDDVSEGDREMMRLGLQLRVPVDGPLTDDDLCRVPTETILQRAFVSHLRSGGHWHKRTGIVWLDR